MIRQAELRDLSRIAEILVFSKRVNFRRIFRDDQYSFGELQVLSAAEEYAADSQALAQTWVYEEDFVKGLIRIQGREGKTLYTDPFFTGQGIGGKLLTFAIDRFDVRYLWALEKKEKPWPFTAGMAFSQTASGSTRKGLWSVCCCWNGKLFWRDRQWSGKH